MPHDGASITSDRHQGSFITVAMITTAPCMPCILKPSVYAALLWFSMFVARTLIRGAIHPGAPGPLEAQCCVVGEVLRHIIIHTQLAATVQLPERHSREELGVAADGVPARAAEGAPDT